MKTAYSPQILIPFWREQEIPPPCFEHRFCPGRKWRIDIAWPEKKVALEVQGGIWIFGRHSRGAAMLKEWEKLTTLAAMGWRVLYCQPKDIYAPELVVFIKQALEQKI